MGKRIISQRRGRGTHTYKSPSHRFKGAVKYRVYDEIESSGMINGKIVDLVNCPGHSAPLAIVEYENKDVVLIPAPKKVKVNYKVASGLNAPAINGNILPLKSIPLGTFVYNIEIKPGDGGKFVKSAGSAARVIAHNNDKTIIKLPSKKSKIINSSCRATIGIIAGGGRKDKPILKAGKAMHIKRAKNKLYPRTSGVAMNSVDHPFGSGRGRHIGKPKTAPRWAPAGRKVGLIGAKKTGRGK